MTRQSILYLVSGYPIFNCCDAQNLNKYLTDDTLMISDFQSGEVIFSPIESKKSVGVILSGTAVATPTSASDNALLKILTTNDIFGIATLYAENDAFPSIITAKSGCSVLFIDGIAFKRLLENDAEAMRAYLEFLSKKIIYLNKKISTLTAGSAEKRLAFFLCENECDGVFYSSASISAIAELLNLGRASLYRAFDTLSEQGLICKEGKKIIIKDKNALLNFQ